MSTCASSAGPIPVRPSMASATSVKRGPGGQGRARGHELRAPGVFAVVQTPVAGIVEGPELQSRPRPRRAADPCHPARPPVQLRYRSRPLALASETAAGREGIEGRQGKALTDRDQPVSERPSPPRQQRPRRVRAREEGRCHLDLVTGGRSLPHHGRLQCRRTHLLRDPRIERGQGECVGRGPQRPRVLERRRGEHRAQAEAKSGRGGELGTILDKRLRDPGSPRARAGLVAPDSVDAHVP
jgi:hypothetical protein